LLASPALAVHVPGDYPTIQAALDAGEIEIVVAQGTYPETLQVRHDLDLRAAGLELPLPTVAGMHITITRPDTEVVHMSYATVQRIHFASRISQEAATNHADFTTSLDACQLDGGFSTNCCPTANGLRVNIRN
jgi:pectin methylesterase-like acyl-CoA thioesterase